MTMYAIVTRKGAEMPRGLHAKKVMEVIICVKIMILKRFA